MNTFEIPLQGLNCMGCARKVEKQLNDNLVVTIGQLSPTSISLTTNASFADIAKQVTSLGYHAGVYKQFALSGLNCGKCVNKLTKHLATNDAISEVNVSKTELSLYTLLSDQAVIDLVAEVGYQASLEAQSHQPDVVKQPETDTQLRTDSFNIASSDDAVSINLLIGCLLYTSPSPRD